MKWITQKELQTKVRLIDNKVHKGFQEKAGILGLYS